MGTDNLAYRISKIEHVEDSGYEDYEMFHFTYSPYGNFPKRYSVFMPTRDDYYLSIEVVNRAIKRKANLIVFDNWISNTMGGQEYAKSKGINSYSYTVFLAKVYNGEPL